MAWLRAATLGLGVCVALAEPGSLRGWGPNRTEAEAALEANTSLNGSFSQDAARNSSASAIGGNLTEAVAASAVASPDDLAGVLEAAGNVSALAVPEDEGAPLLGAAAASAYGSTYWDGQCTPCPAFFYRHCSKGGLLVWSRPCRFGGSWSGCEGLCATAGAPHGQPGLVSQVTRPGVMTLYHETSPELAEKILAGGFRPGRRGWCGGAIYFYWSPNVPETKLGPDSSRGAVIEAKVNMGRMAHLDSRCDGHEDASRKYDSVTFNPGDGDEYIVYSKDRVVSMRRYK